ncbi:MAG: hypothetical protein ACJAT2_001790 [Bacteriovoracaceae bacterium]|jgi:hypothetical protein
MDCGQIDVCVLIKKKEKLNIEVIEAKSGESYLSNTQRQRLHRSCELLSLSFSVPVYFSVSQEITRSDGIM